MDNLRLSMKPGLSDSLVLRYRCNAVTLSRSADQARTMLEALQAGRPVNRDVPRPSVAAAPPQSAATAPSAPKATATAKPSVDDISLFPQDFETMKRDARIMMAGFSRNGLQASSIPVIPDTAALASAAAKDAVSRALRPAGA
jgi:hypothetical protein